MYSKEYASLTSYRPIQISTSNPNPSHPHSMHHFNNHSQFITFPDMQYMAASSDEDSFINQNLGASKLKII